MSFSRRLRTIALSQIQAIQDRLNRIDAEAAEEAEQRRYRREAQDEMNDPTDIRLPMRTPEEIASVIDFLLGPGARFMCGSVLFVDGGSDALLRPDDAPSTYAATDEMLARLTSGRR